MFFVLSKVLSILLNPLVWITLLFILGLVKSKTIYHYLGLGLMLLFTNPFLANWAMSILEYPVKEIGEEKYEVGIVLSGMTIPQIEKPGQLQFGPGSERLIEALRLFKKGHLNKLLISGGSGNLLKPELRESPALEKLSIDLGVPPNRILIETESRNTHENAKFSRTLLEDLGIHNSKILLITSAYHMRRSKACFEKQNLQIEAYPVDFNSVEEIELSMFVPSYYPLDAWNRIIHEWVGWIVYKIRGYI